MFRTLKYIFKKPQGIIKVIQNPKEAVLVIKAKIVGMWYLDVKYAKVDQNVHENLMFFMDATINETYKKRD